MKVLRTQEISVQTGKDFEVGDRIELNLYYMATCQKVTPKGGLFLLDQYLDTPHSMNHRNTNEGGYESSSLRKRLWTGEVPAIFRSVDDRMIPFENGDLIRIPFAEEFFGGPDFPGQVNHEKQWELMKKRTARIGARNGCEKEFGWLQDRYDGSDRDFLVVDDEGDLNHMYAVALCGVRPVFLIG